MKDKRLWFFGYREPYESAIIYACADSEKKILQLKKEIKESFPYLYEEVWDIPMNTWYRNDRNSGPEQL
jgi:hypothetical protein